MARAAVLVVLAALAGVAAAGDIVHQDDEAPKIPGCSNDFMLVRPRPVPSPQVQLVSTRISPSISFVRGGEPKLGFRAVDSRIVTIT
jgi:hypothetical protein